MNRRIVITDDDAVSYGKIAINNETKLKIDIEEIMKEPLKLDFSKKGPEVLIYHTTQRRVFERC